MFSLSGKNNSSSLNVLFKMSESKKALKKCKKTSPGKDMLCYEMFIHLYEYGGMFISNFYNEVWAAGVPSSWRQGVGLNIFYYAH